MRRLRSLLVFFSLMLIDQSAFAERVKDLGHFAGLRENQLTGYGIVVGLAGTGDDSFEYTSLAMKGAVLRFGLAIPAGVNPSLKNAAAVMVTASLPPFSKPGQRLNITVSAIGKAKSLRGGTLLLAPLYGADNQIYAIAQGNLVVGGLGVEAGDGSKLSVNIPSSARIDGGATVERAVDTGFATAEQIVFNLNTPDLTNSEAIAKAINHLAGRSIAEATDGGSVSIDPPEGGPARVSLMSQIENLDIKATEPAAKVIVNSRTGTVVVNGAVKIGPAAVSHGKLTVRIEEKSRIVQPAPFSRGETANEKSSDISVNEESRPMFVMPRGASLAEIVNGINRLGITPGDLVAILQALKEAGALTAELVVI